MNAKKVLGLIFALMFVYACAVQYNDPDPIFWIALYGLGLAASVLFMIDRLKVMWAVVLAILFIVVGVYHWPPHWEGVALKDGMKTLDIELGRESLGMGFSAVIMLLYIVMIRKGNS